MKTLSTLRIVQLRQELEAAQLEADSLRRALKACEPEVVERLAALLMSFAQTARAAVEQAERYERASRVTRIKTQH